jgi:AraC family transcriptional regulator
MRVNAARLSSSSSNAHRYAEASLACSSAIPLRLLDTSASTGWTSLLVNLQVGTGTVDTFETHATDDLSLTIDVAGRHEVHELLDGRWRSAIFQPGITCLTPAGETARVRLIAKAALEAFRTIHVYLPSALIDDVADEYRRVGQVVGTARVAAYRGEVLAGQAGALLAAARAGAPDLYAASAAHWIATHILSRQANWRHVADDARLSGTITDRRLARVIEYMSCHLDQQLTLNELAREAGISVHHFGKRFRERIGMGPAAYLTELRMERARLFLATTDLPVSEVGLRCGYPRASAFSTAFLRQTGQTPSAFRSTS